MNHKRKYIFVIRLFAVFFVMLFMTGCSASEHMSLEDALILAVEETIVLTESEAEQSTEEPELLYVYVCGAVSKPGVYTLVPGSRIVAVIEAAGGFLPEAATEAINLAGPAWDGMQIIVPTTAEYESVKVEAAMQEKGLVNLNTATAEDLCELSGIGEAKAEAILAYRAEIGGFTSIEQMKEVSGIGDSLFQKIKKNIYID